MTHSSNRRVRKSKHSLSARACSGQIDEGYCNVSSMD